MRSKSILVALGVVAGTLLWGGTNVAEARDFGTRAGTVVRLGIGGRSAGPPRYYGPGFYAAPRSRRSYRADATQFQQRPWYYYRAGPFEYYRPYRPLYQRR